MAKETDREGTLTLRLEKQGDEAVNLVVTVLPVALNRDELLLEAQKMLEASLYRIQILHEAKEQEISGRRMILIDAVAGEKEKVLTRTAVFSDGKRTYLLTLLAKEAAFASAVAEFARVLASLGLD
jgi:hypothetical protein